MTVVLSVFIAYTMMTGLWAAVLANFIYEAQQVILLGLVLVALLHWTGERPEIGKLVLLTFVWSLAPATLLGLLQASIDLSFSSPSAPSSESGIPHSWATETPWRCPCSPRSICSAYLALLGRYDPELERIRPKANRASESSLVSSWSTSLHFRVALPTWL